MHLTGARRHLSYKGLVVAVGHDDSLDADAGLARVAHGAPQRRIRRRTDIRVVVDDEGVLAAALHQDRREVFSAGAHYLASGRRAAGEGDLVDG